MCTTSQHLMKLRIRAMLQQEAANNASEVYSAQMQLVENRLTELKSIREDLSEQVRTFTRHSAACNIA
jgi:hypothetical protein